MTTTSTREALATTAEVAAYLGRTPKTLRNWRCLGIGPRYIGRHDGVRYRWSDVEAYLKEQQSA